MDKRIYIFAAIVLITTLLGLLIYNYFEIVPYKRVVYPSREAISNNYLAMERWLKETGLPVRYINYLDLARLHEIHEKVIVVQPKAYIWGNMEEMIPWVEQGGFILISIDSSHTLWDFLAGYGVIINTGFDRISYPAFDIQNPAFDMQISFLIEKEDNLFYLEDSYGFIRLVEIPIGHGAITVTGLPFFMYNRRLGEEANAALSWNLTGARAQEDNGVLFIRDYQIPTKQILGALMERGNLIPVGISALVIIVIGFWMIIPLFGLVFTEKQRSSRPIKDRFYAEIQFLRKYRALDYYLDVYEREQKTGEYNKQNDKYSYRKLINQYRRIFNGTTNL
jgi:hypothetical protein